MFPSFGREKISGKEMDIGMNEFKKVKIMKKSQDIMDNSKVSIKKSFQYTEKYPTKTNE